MSSGKGKKTSTQTQTVELPPYLTNELKYGIEESRRLYDEGVPAYFEGPSYAGFDPLQQEAMNRTLDMARQGSPLVDKAQGFVGSTLDTPSGQNPYLDQYLQKIARETNAVVQSNFNKSGRLGSGANAATAGRAITEAQLPFLFSQYNQDNANKFQAAGMAPGLAEQDYIDVNRIGTVGDAQQGMSQNAINDALQKWQYETNGDATLLDQYLSRINDSGANALTTTTNMTQTKGGGGLGSVLGSALSLASMFTPAGPLAGLGAAGGFGIGSALQGLGMGNMFGAIGGAGNMLPASVQRGILFG